MALSVLHAAESTYSTQDPATPLRVEELTVHQGGRTEILPGGQPHGGNDALIQGVGDYDSFVASLSQTDLQPRMDALARFHEQSRLASTVAHMEAEIQRMRDDQARTVATAAAREHALHRRLEEAMQASAASADEAGRRIAEQTQIAQWRVRQLEQRLAVAEAERHEYMSERATLAAEAAGMRDEVRRCRQQTELAKSAEEAALRATKEATDDAAAAWSSLEAARDEAAQAVDGAAHAHALKERALEARCEQLQNEAAGVAEAAGAAAAAREHERGAVALERVMRTAARQEEAWGAQLPRTLR